MRDEFVTASFIGIISYATIIRIPGKTNQYSRMSDGFYFSAHVRFFLYDLKVAFLECQHWKGLFFWKTSHCNAEFRRVFGKVQFLQFKVMFTCNVWKGGLCIPLKINMEQNQGGLEDQNMWFVGGMLIFQGVYIYIYLYSVNDWQTIWLISCIESGLVGDHISLKYHFRY